MKECHFKFVDAVQNCDDCVRDAFITGLCSNIIRQRLPENKTLHLNIAIDQARVLHAAQKNSEAYTYTQTPIVGAVSQENTSTSVQSMDPMQLRLIPSISVSSVEDLVIIEVCVQPEMQLVSSVKKEGHFSKMCRSNPKITSAATCSHRLVTMLISNITSAS